MQKILPNVFSVDYELVMKHLLDPNGQLFWHSILQHLQPGRSKTRSPGLQWALQFQLPRWVSQKQGCLGSFGQITTQGIRHGQNGQWQGTTDWKVGQWVKVTQSCWTLCDPMDYTVHGILQARILGWVAFPFSRRSSQPRDRTQVSHIAGRFFTSWATRVFNCHIRVKWL